MRVRPRHAPPFLPRCCCCCGALVVATLHGHGVCLAAPRPRVGSLCRVPLSERRFSSQAACTSAERETGVRACRPLPIPPSSRASKKSPAVQHTAHPTRDISRLERAAVPCVVAGVAHFLAAFGCASSVDANPAAARFASVSVRPPRSSSWRLPPTLCILPSRLPLPPARHAVQLGACAR